tara:strand:- start:1 stop:852 length:852 start_codon:yes stop_codon:yes gene_type:complete
MDRSFIENNLVAGVYTNNDKYFKKFTDNWKENYQNVELIYNVQAGKINENMERLRHKFIATGKRYWLFMDEDILFTRNDVIETCIKYMKKNDLDLITTYQTTDYELASKLDPRISINLPFEYITWSAGYFMLVDSKKCGLVPFDLNLPTTHGNLSDLAYCLDIIEQADALIGIAPTMIYHADCGYSPKVTTPFKITNKNTPKVNANVRKFLKNLNESQYYGNRQIEIVFLGNGEIDENETIGGHYLKCKHPNIYKEIVARHHYNLVHTNKKDNFTFTKDKNSI